MRRRESQAARQPHAISAGRFDPFLPKASGSGLGKVQVLKNVDSLGFSRKNDSGVACEGSDRVFNHPSCLSVMDPLERWHTFEVPAMAEEADILINRKTNTLETFALPPGRTRHHSYRAGNFICEPSVVRCGCKR